MRQVLVAILDQATEHDDLAVLDGNGRADRALVGHDVRRIRSGCRDTRNLLIDFEPNTAALVDLGPDLQRDAHVSPFDRLERVGYT